MCGQSSAYNINATLLPTNPLFQGFSSYPNVNKEIIKRLITGLLKPLEMQCFQGFFCTVNWKSGSSLYETETINK